MEEIEDYRVYSIKIDSAITIDYSFKKFNEYSGKAVKIKLYDKPHEDFYKALDGIKECFYQMIGFPMAEAETGQKLNVITYYTSLLPYRFKRNFCNRNKWLPDCKIYPAALIGADRCYEPHEKRSFPFCLLWQKAAANTGRSCAADTDR